MLRYFLIFAILVFSAPVFAENFDPFYDQIIVEFKNIQAQYEAGFLTNKERGDKLFNLGAKVSPYISKHFKSNPNGPRFQKIVPQNCKPSDCEILNEVGRFFRHQSHINSKSGA